MHWQQHSVHDKYDKCLTTDFWCHSSWNSDLPYVNLTNRSTFFISNFTKLTLSLANKQQLKFKLPLAVFVRKKFSLLFILFFFCLSIKLFCLAACTNGLIYKNTNKTKMFRNTIRANNKMHVILNFYFPQVALPIATKCHVQVFSGTLFTNSTTNLAVKHYFYQLILSLALQCLWFSSSEDPNSCNHNLTFHY